MKISIYHNILWSKYKGIVFSRISRIIEEKKYNDIEIDFIQISETDSERSLLSDIDLDYHLYNYELLFKGSYNKIPSLKLGLVLFFHVWNSKADVIIIPGFSKFENWTMLIAALLKNIKVGLFCDSTIHDHIQLRWKSLFKKTFIKFVDIFFCYGERSKEYLLSLGGDSKKITIRCQSAALPLDYCAENELKNREKLIENNINTSPIFLYVGRLATEKNIEKLLIAFSHVLKTIPMAKLNLVGQGPNREYLENKARKLGISEFTTFLGSMELDKLIYEYRRSSALILPSHSEPWGLVVNEALSYGCPVLVSNRCGCIPELVINGVTGFSFNPDDLQDLVNCMSLVSSTLNSKKTAKDCISLIKQFNPESAANRIIEGCTNLNYGIKNN